MNTTLILAALAFAVGFAWGFRKPAGYCSMSREQQHGFMNRCGSGLINGIVLAAITAGLAYIVFGSGLTPGADAV